MNNNVTVLEFRPGTGGDEAKIWATDLLRMYLRFAQKAGWKTTLLADDVLKITGEGAYDLLKHESGVHRVQRIPATEKSGRIHTSTATLAVLPEIREHEVRIHSGDLDWQFFRASSHGGQNVNKVSTAVRLTHKPTNITVTCQTQRQQHQNRETALALLRGKLWERQQQQQAQARDSARATIGRGMRAEKIRTYNYPQNRVTDHRINKSWHNLEQIVDGNVQKVLKKVSAQLA